MLHFFVKTSFNFVSRSVLHSLNKTSPEINLNYPAIKIMVFFSNMNKVAFYAWCDSIGKDLMHEILSGLKVLFFSVFWLDFRFQFSVFRLGSFPLPSEILMFLFEMLDRSCKSFYYNTFLWFWLLNKKLISLMWKYKII